MRGLRRGWDKGVALDGRSAVGTSCPQEIHENLAVGGSAIGADLLGYQPGLSWSQHTVVHELHVSVRYRHEPTGDDGRHVIIRCDKGAQARGTISNARPASAQGSGGRGKHGSGQVEGLWRQLDQIYKAGGDNVSFEREGEAVPRGHSSREDRRL